MKKKDIGLIIGILILSSVLFWYFSFIKQETGGYLKISIANELYGIYDLSADQVIDIDDSNKCRISDGKVEMIYGDCPDQICVHTKAVSHNGQTIVCMPNKVVLEILSEEDSLVDTMTR